MCTVQAAICPGQEAEHSVGQLCSRSKAEHCTARLCPCQKQNSRWHCAAISQQWTRPRLQFPLEQLGAQFPDQSSSACAHEQNQQGRIGCGLLIHSSQLCVPANNVALQRFQACKWCKTFITGTASLLAVPAATYKSGCLFIPPHETSSGAGSGRYQALSRLASSCDRLCSYSRCRLMAQPSRYWE